VRNVITADAPYFSRRGTVICLVVLQNISRNFSRFSLLFQTVYHVPCYSLLVPIKNAYQLRLSVTVKTTVMTDQKKASKNAQVSTFHYRSCFVSYEYKLNERSLKLRIIISKRICSPSRLN
jgi:hypothetical protein